ncbi:bifunctional phosphopantothenoylcysteine decarboxylase/phosphopantothenate--cysteine ligase CoaBC [Iamia sp.]|uniref:bifunctional phosphopantothenoylcysteine decarboxylase/phosphopantothenate--cysteine ligase CoaBC n=1 Tax=Iamia sp. TaxID=2722710 RepID=UPI002C678477|nr:bifunctional phosphopantothenoylcysteine decarboxylase/phosphopantothenate--cysteine ligase CoaBC [Iamia sp.]HXH57860.1 bifunctional phosphopantothenoylcysteine decarboxylase/phosphopantothenate--cysteine ligase CoaBC [Iamia sp.]
MPFDPPSSGAPDLAGQRVVLGVTGGIAAYKAIELCRRLVDAGAHVSPVLTEGALRFVGATTFSALASEPVRTSLFDDADPIPHTRLGQAADVVVVAPATARLLADYAAGRSADLLTATLLATRAPVVLAPAMHTEMWEHPAVQENLATLIRRGVVVVPPEDGRLAGGDIGAGRLADPATIVAAVRLTLVPRDLEGVPVLVTAGGTRERIDAVRVVTNRSSGKQGYAIAAEAAARGARVTLVTTVPRPVPPGVTEVVTVESAADMEGAVVPRAPDQEVIVMAAAVADFRPVRPAAGKIKKHDGPPTIALEATHDFLVDLGAAKPAGQVLVGFAAETDDVRANARAKLVRKGLDLIVANDVSAPGVGFEHDTNQVVLVSGGGIDHDVPLSDKRTVARAVIDAVVALRPPVARGTVAPPQTRTQKAKETNQ